MLTFEKISDAREALMEFRFTKISQLPDEKTQQRLKELVASPSPVDQIVGGMELLYANREHLDDEGRELVGALAGFATANAWHGLQDDERGSKIVLAMARDSGQKPIPGFKFPKAENDPETAVQFRQEPTPPEPPADPAPNA